MTNFHLGRFLGKRCELSGQEGLTNMIGGRNPTKNILDLAVHYLQLSLSVFNVNVGSSTPLAAVPADAHPYLQDYPVDFISIQLEIARVCGRSIYGCKEGNMLASLQHIIEARKGLAVLKTQQTAPPLGQSKEKEKEKEKEQEKEKGPDKTQGDGKDKNAIISAGRCALLLEAELSQQLREIVKYYAQENEKRNEKAKLTKEKKQEQRQEHSSVTEVTVREMYRLYLMEKKAGTSVADILDKLAALLPRICPDGGHGKG